MKRPVMKKESRQLVLSSALLIVLSLCAYLFLVWEPQQAELSRMALREAELKTARLEMESFLRRHPDADRYEKELAVRETRAGQLFLSGESETDEFFRGELPRLAESSGLIVEQLTAGVAEAERQRETERLRARLCRLAVRGSYRSMTGFLFRLEQGERFVSVKSWQLKRSAGQPQGGELVLEMLVEAYELKPHKRQQEENTLHFSD